MTLDVLFQPKTFNYIIMVLYALNAFWWLYHGSKAQSIYWVGALILTAGLTAMDKEGPI